MATDKLWKLLDECAQDIVEYAFDTQRQCAYVVPKSTSGVLKENSLSASSNTDLMLVKHIPVTSDGVPDFDLLADYPFVNPDLVQRCQSALSNGMESIAVAREYFEPEKIVLYKDQYSGYTPDDSQRSEPELDSNKVSSEPAYAVGPELKWSGPDHTTLVEALKAAATSERGITYLEEGEQSFESYAELIVAARKSLHGLQKMGLRKGDPLPLQIADRREHFHVLWGCALGGIIPVTIAIPNRYEADNPVFQKLLGVWKLLGARHVLTSASHVEALKGLFPAEAIICDVTQLDLSNEGEEASITPNDVLFYQLTSGSTGTPKCIPETHAAIISHIQHSTVDVGYTPEDRTLNWLPFDHVVPMLTFHLKDVYLACQAYQATTAEILAKPIRWLDLMQEHRINYSWSPNFGFKLLVSAVKKFAAESGGTPLQWDLSCVKKLMNAGEQVTVDVCDDFLRLSGLETEVMQPAFGMAEVCTCMTYANDYGTPGVSVHRILKSKLPNIVIADEQATESETLQVIDLGTPSPGVEIRITQGSGNKVLRENQVGHLQIRGACVMQGYHQNPEANAECFPGDGWFDSGDLGFIRNDRLILTGRAKEQIIVRGANFYAYEIEDSIAEIKGCVASFVAATSVHSDASGTEAVLIFFVPDSAIIPEIVLSNLSKGVLVPKLKEVVARIHSHVASSFGVNPDFVVPVSTSQFHKTTSGKIQRGAFKKAFLKGDYSGICDTLQQSLQQQGVCTPDWYGRVVWRRRGVVDVHKASELCETIVFQQPGCEIAKHLGTKNIFSECTENTWQRCRELVELDQGRVWRIVYAWPCSKKPTGNLYQGLIQLGQCLDGVRAKVELYVLTSGACLVDADDQADPEYLAHTGCLSGITKALNAELGCIKKAVQIDIDLQLLSDPSAIAEALQAECRCHHADQEVAIRRGERYVKRYESIGKTLASEVTSSAEGGAGYFTKGGVYIVTGGLGAIGVEVVKLILEVEDTSVLILGRSDDGDERLRVLGWKSEAGSSRVSYAQVDLGTDRQKLEQQVAGFLRQSGKPLLGVVHLAGHYSRQQVSELDSQTFAEATRTKVQGSIDLHDVLKNLSSPEHKPTFLHFGSVASFFAGQGLAAYSGCCAFQEVFSEFQQSDGVDSRIYVWSIWENTGIGGRDKTLGFAPWVCPIDKNQGIFILKALLNFTHQRSICVGINLHHPELARLAVNTADLGLHSLCVFYTPEQCIDVATLENLSLRPNFVCIPEVPVTAQGSIDTETLTSASIKALTAVEQAGPQNEMEEKLFEIWSQVLATRNLGRDDNFFELGGDSLSWMEMVMLANKAFDLKMNAMQIMRHGAITELAEYVRNLALSSVNATSSENAPDTGKVLVVLKKGSDPMQPPVFLFPTVAGTTSCYNEMLSQMDAVRPMVGVLDPYLVGDRHTRSLDFESWMEIYANAVQGRQPHGPYTLMSYSQGSTWLWGTAEHLIRRGEVVDKCILLDPFFPGWNGCRDGFEWMVTWTNAVLKFLPKSLLRMVTPWAYGRMIGLGLPMKTEREREVSIAKTFKTFTSFLENLWLYLIFMELDTGIRVLEEYSELKHYPKDQYEDRVDFICRKCAEKLDDKVDVQYLKDVLYVQSSAFLRASVYSPQVLPPSTSVTVIAPERRGLSLSKETKLDRYVSPGQLQEIDVPVEKFEKKRHITGRLKGFFLLLELHFRCMHDQQFIVSCVDELRKAGIAR
jgi:acyl-CoA synthetase (AMP-forming)/AMP-acid ligase II/NADP-dependent 3-hydroxy acid dehydrogenase YdfG/acyl carrier protein